jgi:GR25 family glycosyltransferase involved in LPS biosynthesis
MTNPKTFLIVLQGHKESEQVASECLASAKKFDWEIEIFPAINGNTITDQTWKDYGLKNSRHRPADLTQKGTQGCFLSHWTLWNRCVELNKTIVVLEQDSIIGGYYPAIPKTNGIIKLHPEYGVEEDPISGTWTPSTHAYYIEPLTAKQIIEFVKTHGWMAVDVLLGSNVVDVYHTSPELVGRQNKFSTTVNLPDQ